MITKKRMNNTLVLFHPGFSSIVPFLYTFNISLLHTHFLLFPLFLLIMMILVLNKWTIIVLWFALTYTHSYSLSWSYGLNKLLKGVVETIFRNKDSIFFNIFRRRRQRRYFRLFDQNLRGMNIFIIISSKACSYVCAVIACEDIKVHFFHVHAVLLNYYNDDVMELSKLL